MKRSVKIALIVSTCMILAGIFLAGFSFPLFLRSIPQTMEQVDSTVTILEEPFHSVRMNTVDEDIRIEIGQTAQITYRNFDQVLYGAHVTDGTLNIDQLDSRKWYENLFQFGRKTPDITLTLPVADYQNLWIQSVSGDISLPAGLSFTETDLVTVSGDLQISGLQGTLLKAETTSGEMELNRVVLQSRIQLQSVSGDLDLEACDAPDLYLSTTSGDIEAELLSRKKFLVTTSSGDVDVPPNFETQEVCTVETTSGDISIETEIIG